MNGCFQENSLLHMENSFVVMPKDANHYGNVHGGVMMLYIDNLAYALASQLCRLNVVTARISEMVFNKPVKVGDLVILSADIVRVGNSSMDIKICVRGEKLLSGAIFDVAEAEFTMVAVDEAGKPKKIERAIS